MTHFVPDYQVFIANMDYDNWTLHSSSSYKDVSRKEAKRIMNHHKRTDGIEKQTRIIQKDTTKLVSHFVWEAGRIVDKINHDS